MQHVFFSNKDKIDSPDVKLNALPIVLGSSGRGDNQFIKELTRGTCRNNPYRKKQTIIHYSVFLYSKLLKKSFLTSSVTSQQ